MLEFIIAMENETGEMCFYYLFIFYGILLCGNDTSWAKIYICIYALCVDNTGQFMTGSFIVLVPKTKKMKPTMKSTGARCPWQVCKTGVLSSIPI